MNRKAELARPQASGYFEANRARMDCKYCPISKDGETRSINCLDVKEAKKAKIADLAQQNMEELRKIEHSLSDSLPENAPPSLIKAVTLWKLAPPYQIGTEEVWARYVKAREKLLTTSFEENGELHKHLIAIRFCVTRSMQGSVLRDPPLWIPRLSRMWPLSFHREVFTLLLCLEHLSIQGAPWAQVPKEVPSLIISALAEKYYGIHAQEHSPISNVDHIYRDDTSISWEDDDVPRTTEAYVRIAFLTFATAFQYFFGLFIFLVHMVLPLRRSSLSQDGSQMALSPTLLIRRTVR